MKKMEKEILENRIQQLARFTAVKMKAMNRGAGGAWPRGREACSTRRKASVLNRRLSEDFY